MKKKLIVLSFILVCFATWIFYSCNPPKDKIEIAKQLVDDDLEIWQQYLQDTLAPSAEKSTSSVLLQKHFIKARILYKKVEWFTEYFMPTSTRFVNGPPLPQVEQEENKIFEPLGLQVIEPLLFPRLDTANRKELLRQIIVLQTYAKRYQNYLRDIDFDDSHIFDAARLHVFRIVTLGISGFDAPLAKSSIPEAAASLQSIQRLIKPYLIDNKDALAVNQQFEKAVQYLSTHTNFDTFDRLYFITGHANPLSKQLHQLQTSLSIPFIVDARLLRPDAITLFDKNAFDVNALLPDSFYTLTSKKAALGKKLFYDQILSSNKTRSCASCHQPQKAFTDGLPKSISFSNGFIKRNAPTLLNAALQPVQFYDMRVTSLENQAHDVINNKDEMHGSLDEALMVIRKDEAYNKLFKQAYPNGSEIGLQHLQNALASYVRTLISLNSQFDQYMRGNESQLNEGEKLGFNLFMGKAKCGTCHFLPLFNGTVPPMFREMESEVIGVPKTAVGTKLDDDPGRYAITSLEPYRNAFKTTTIRNAALTAPYMHNGVFSTLEEVVNFYTNGGGVGLGFKVENQTLPFDKLVLNEKEKNALIQFMQALNDNQNTYHNAVRVN